MPANAAPHRALVDAFARDGFAVARGLFPADETAALRDHCMRLRAEGAKPGDSHAYDPAAADPWARFPRMIQMHRWDERLRAWLLDARLRDLLTALTGGEPIALQSMVYFKPPGGRGQALHQDQLYLRVEPGTCVAAWLALDACDAANGCMRVVPGSHRLPLLCLESADESASVTPIVVPVPPGMRAVEVPMAAGDALVFGGSMIHGSLPNATADRFRRALIGHYAVAGATRAAEWFSPGLRFDGAPAPLGASAGGGPCGRFEDGRLVMDEQRPLQAARE